MVAALMISIVLIFFILLFQFRDLKETTIVMLTIPLSLFGAFFGLYITHNNFGFTAFVGLVSLSGIVVRNAIILVDHTNELLKEGMDIRTAAIESGKRRLPIFLTAMAAAIGVLPMILSVLPCGALGKCNCFRSGMEYDYGAAHRSCSLHIMDKTKRQTTHY
jgi:multidrug efflux pump subunit AcrB